MTWTLFYCDECGHNFSLDDTEPCPRCGSLFTFMDAYERDGPHGESIFVAPGVWVCSECEHCWPVET